MDFIMDALYMQSNVLSVRAHVYKMHDSLTMACGEGFPHLYPPGVFTMMSRSLASQKRVTAALAAAPGFGKWIQGV